MAYLSRKQNEETQNHQVRAIPGGKLSWNYHLELFLF